VTAADGPSGAEPSAWARDRASGMTAQLGLDGVYFKNVDAVTPLALALDAAYERGFLDGANASAAAIRKARENT